jgi:hypothetical protein
MLDDSSRLLVVSRNVMTHALGCDEAVCSSTAARVVAPMS